MTWLQAALLMFVFSSGLKPIKCSQCLVVGPDIQVAPNYLPYLQLDSPQQVTSRVRDECSNPIHIPGGLPFGNITTPTLSVCENGVILTDPSELSVCMCRELESPVCPLSSSDLHLIAPLWADVNNISATDSSLSFQVFDESASVAADRSILKQVWEYVHGSLLAIKAIENVTFFPSWMMAAHWRDVHPYVNPNERDLRRNTFQAVILTDGITSFAIFTYNCTNLEWAETNSFVLLDCSFIGIYSGGDFANPCFDGLQRDYHTADTSLASCYTDGTSWNNYLFSLTTNFRKSSYVLAAERQIKALVGDTVAINFTIGTFTAISVQLSIEPEGGGMRKNIVIPCDAIPEPIFVSDGNVVVESLFGCARVLIRVGSLVPEGFGRYIVTASFADQVDSALTVLTQAPKPEEEMAQELRNMTSNPETLSSEDIADASVALENLTQSAIDNENVIEDYLVTIDNVLRAKRESIVESQVQNQSSTRIINSLSQFTSQVKLPRNSTNVTFTFQSYGIQLFDVSPETFQGQNFAVNLGSLQNARNLSNPLNIENISDELDNDATLYVQVAPETLENSQDSANRLSFVVYRQDSIFLNNTNATESGITIDSLVVSVNSSSSVNAESDPPIIIGYIQDTQNEIACSEFNPGGSGGLGAWSGDNCREVTCRSREGNHTCCECHIFGHFGLLLSVTPGVLKKSFQTVLVVFSYLGASISILSLTILLITYILAKKLRASTNGNLLINLAISLLGVYIFFLIGGHIRMYGDSKTTDVFCGLSSAFLHYFMLTYFGWTAAEAVHLYFCLVKVFESQTISRFPLKAGLIVWLVPLAVVVISGGAGNQYYVNDVYCRPVQWPFYFAFILPIFILLLFDYTMFILIMISLYKHTKRREKLLNKDKKALRVIKRSTRYAIFLSSLFGLGWIFGLIATGYPEPSMALTFTLQFFFCVFVSAQGLLLFVFQVIVSKEAKNFWLFVFKTCLSSLKLYEPSKRKPSAKKKSSRFAHRLSNLLRRPPPEAATTTLEPSDNTTLGRRQHLDTTLTESFEASYHNTRHSRLDTNSTFDASPTSAPSEGTTTVATIFPNINFDQLSLQDEV